VMRELHVTVDGTKFGGKQPGDCAVDIDRSSLWAMVAPYTISMTKEIVRSE
jgi:hypothetical protein